MGKRVPLAQPTFWRDVFIPASEGDRLKGNKSNLLGILSGKVDDGAYLVVIHPINQRRHQNNLNARFVHVINGSQLDIEQVADLAMTVGIVANTIELQVGIP